MANPAISGFSWLRSRLPYPATSDAWRSVTWWKGGESMSTYRIQVTWLDTGEVFPSIQEAARHMPVSRASLDRAYHGGKSEACGLKVSFDVIQDVRGNFRSVKNLTTGEVSPSLTAAARACGGNSQGVREAIKNGRKYRGQWWRYASKKPF